LCSSGNCRFRDGFPVLYIGVSLRLNIETKTSICQTTYPISNDGQADDSQKEENRKELHFRQASWGVVNPTSKWVVFYIRCSFLYRYLTQPSVFSISIETGTKGGTLETVRISSHAYRNWQPNGDTYSRKNQTLVLIGGQGNPQRTELHPK
jgi:hypothetical protein